MAHYQATYEGIHDGRQITVIATLTLDLLNFEHHFGFRTNSSDSSVKFTRIKLGSAHCLRWQRRGYACSLFFSMHVPFSQQQRAEFELLVSILNRRWIFICATVKTFNFNFMVNNSQRLAREVWRKNLGLNRTGVNTKGRANLLLFAKRGNPTNKRILLETNKAIRANTAFSLIL